MQKIHLNHFLTLAIYNRTMNQKLYSAAQQLSEIQLKENRKAFFGSVFHTLQHILVADLIWLRRFEAPECLHPVAQHLASFPDVNSLEADIAENLSDLQQLRVKLDTVILNFISSLRPADLGNPLSYKNLAGKNFESPVWFLLTHFFNHQTHHRGQVTTLLSQFGIDVGVTDFHSLVKENLKTLSSQ